MIQLSLHFNPFDGDHTFLTHLMPSLTVVVKQAKLDLDSAESYTLQFLVVTSVLCMLWSTIMIRP